MSGKPKGSQKDASYRACRACGASITFRLRKGKPHPYNPDGTSHFDTCLHAQRFRPPSLRHRGDMDTEKRQKWRSQQVFFEEGVSLDWHSVALYPLPIKHLLPILDVLEAKGGPFECGVPYPVENIHTCAVCQQTHTVKAVILHDALYRQLLGFFLLETLGVKGIGIAGYALMPVSAVDGDVWQAYLERL